MPSLAAAAAMLLVQMAAAVGSWRDEPLHAPTPHTADQLPPVVRQLPPQREAMAKMRAAAVPTSEAATPKLLDLIDGVRARATIRRCCSRLANASSYELLGLLRASVYASELVHNFEGSFDEDVSIDILADNTSDHFPNSWQLRYLGFFGPRINPSWGHPASPEDAGEEGIFGLPPFAGEFDEPTTWAAASSRLLYVALNMMRIDVGNPMFGPVSGERTAACRRSFSLGWAASLRARPLADDLSRWAASLTPMRPAVPLVQRCSPQAS